ncbi:MAG: DUF2207 domain-containing protein [Candidatus Omnitrophica bacterium]|nr:DUF2207 domain-containing protein [Candidatus Omnitrophota bacterium]
MRFILTLLFICLFFQVAYAEEQILSFHSDIELAKDSSMLVTETIRVVSEGRQIKRGIYRDFPIKYKDASGRIKKVKFKIIEVLRNGEKITYKVKQNENNKRVYMGDFHKTIPSSEYIYTLVYKTNNHIRSNENNDQLYYNITGNNWSFSIVDASVAIRFPDYIDSTLVKCEAYTGELGSKEHSFASELGYDKTLYVHSTRTLKPLEGITVNIYFPKGSFDVRLFDEFQLFGKHISGNMVRVGGVLFIFIYFFIAWIYVGKDPAKGEIHLRTSPPSNISPALMRYIKKMQYDDKMLTCALVNMASKGYLVIEEKKEGFSIIKSKKTNKQMLSEDERKISKYLVTNKKIMLSGINHSKIRKSIDALQKVLKKQANRVYFYNNTQYYLPGLFFSLIYILICLSLGFQNAFPMLMGCILSLVVLNVLFFYLMKAPTKKGRKVLEEIEGFRRYLLEKKNFTQCSSYDVLVKHYEKHLAYAIALDIENIWEGLFKEVFASDEVKAQHGLNEYCPTWYWGGYWTVNGCVGFAHHIGNFYAVSSPSGTGTVASGGYGGYTGSSSGGGGAGGGSGGGGGGGF